MSFFSMLQMARGKEPPAQQNSKPDASATSKAGSAARSGPTPPKAQISSPPPEPVEKPSVSTKSGAGSPVYKNHNGRQPSTTSKSVIAPRVSPAPSRQAGKSAKPRPAPVATGNVSKNSTKQAAASGRSPRSSVIPGSQSAAPPSGASARKKLSFRDVMDQASKVNTSKLEINLRTKDSRKQSVETGAGLRKSRLNPSYPATEDERALSDPPSENASPAAPVSARARKGSPPVSVGARFRRNEPAPVAQPFPEVLEKRRRQLEAKNATLRRRREEEEDLGDFIASEDEGEEDIHDEIWRMFNRGPKRRYVDYESDDDMEARGDDILNEERRSALQARREDAEEERKLAELTRRKQQQQQRKRS